MLIIVHPMDAQTIVSNTCINVLLYVQRFHLPRPEKSVLRKKHVFAVNLKFLSPNLGKEFIFWM